MKVLDWQKPPNFEEIAAVFPMVRKKAVFFAYGDRIYNPTGAPLNDALMAHETVHGERQGKDVEGWWRKYLADRAFRLAEEIPAHQAEFRIWARTPGMELPMPGFRSRLEFHRIQIAKRLASPLYGNLISVTEAKALLCAS